MIRILVIIAGFVRWADELRKPPVAVKLVPHLIGMSHGNRRRFTHTHITEIVDGLNQPRVSMHSLNIISSRLPPTIPPLFYSSFRAYLTHDEAPMMSPRNIHQSPLEHGLISTHITEVMFRHGWLGSSRSKLETSYLNSLPRSDR